MNQVQQLQDRLQFAIDIARSAGRRICEHFSTGTPVERKADDTPVTVADREAERWLRAKIQQRYPDDGIVGEEHGDRLGSSEYRWILDPIDGTKSFIAGVPLFSTLVAVQQNERSLLGVIELPALDRRVWALLGSGAFAQHGNRPPVATRVAGAPQLADGLYVTSEVRSFAERGAASVHQALEQRSWYARTWGDGYGYYLVATGQALLMVDPILNLWDAAALLPVIVESGGVFCDWQGKARVDAGESIATTPAIAQEVLAITAPFARHAREQ